MPGGHPSAAHDAGLIDAVARRDQGALAELYDRHCRLVFSLALRILKDRGEAEDVLQDVFVRVWDRADKYDAALGTPSAWLARIGRNRAIDRLRSRAVRATLSLPEVDASAAGVDAGAGADPEGLAVTGEQRTAIVAALSSLPENQRSLIESAYFEGYTQSELAERFNLPLGTVKTRIRAAMQALRAALQGNV